MIEQIGKTTIRDDQLDFISGFQASYAILGAGRLGLAMAKVLRETGRQVLLIDKDEAKIQSLRDAEFTAYHSDFSQPGVLELLNVEHLKAALVMGTNSQANIAALQLLRERRPDIHVVIRVTDNDQKLRDLNLEPCQILNPYADTALRLAHDLAMMERLSLAQQLFNHLKSIGGQGELGIVLQTTPDPDGIASAMALQTIAAEAGVKADILHAGELGHQANRAMVNVLEIPLLRLEDAAWRRYSHLALVDVAIPGENNGLPSDITVDFVIDHHETSAERAQATFTDLRADLGATATIFVEYLSQLELDISSRLATALLYGIRTDTDEFRRNVAPQDLRAAATLLGLADQQLLRQFESPARSQETVEVLGRAISNKRIKGSVLVTDAGSISDKDTLAQAADYLVTMEGISTALVFGLSQEAIYISARNRDIRINIGKILEQAFAGVGSAGGHRTMAGAQIPLGLFSGLTDRHVLHQLAEQAVTERVFRALGS